MKLISKEYRKLNTELHDSKKGFGASGYRWAGIVRRLVKLYNVQSLIDYGCGQETLIKTLRRNNPRMFQKIKYQGYDPCVPKNKGVPNKSDMVMCTDVLEHIEPDYLVDVLQHIFSLSNGIIFFNINTKKANKCLPDGRNTHLIIQDGEWWSDAIAYVSGWGQIILPTQNDKNFNIVLVKGGICE